MNEPINAEKLVIQKVEIDNLQLFWGLLEAMGENKDDEYYTGVLEAQSVGRVELLTASYEGEVCAYGILSWKPKYAPFKRLGIPEIQDLNVLPAYRQRGIATAFILACENMARAKGHDTIGIGVGVHSGFGPAQRLYVKLGYQPDGQGVNYDRKPVIPGEVKCVDDDMSLMLMKSLVEEGD